MNASRALIVSFVALVASLSLIFGFCNGNVGFKFGSPVSVTSLQINITTTGLPALAGFLLLIVGLVFLIWAVLGAIAAQFAPPSINPAGRR